MEDYASGLKALGPASVVQVVPNREAHRNYVASVEAFQPPELSGSKVAMPSGNHPLVDHGGSVIAIPQVQALYFGAMWFDPLRMDTFLHAVVEDGYLDHLQPFGSGRGIFQGSRTINPIAGKFTSDQIQSVLQDLLTSGQVSGANLYLLFLPDGVEVDMGGDSLSCAAWCGYHSAIDEHTFYAVLPATRCPSCYEDSPFGGLTMVTAHEIAEACNDAVPGQGWFVDAPGDPYDGWENGDMAAWPNPPLEYAGESVQGYWTGSRVEVGEYAPAPTKHPTHTSLTVSGPAPLVAPTNLGFLARVFGVPDADVSGKVLFKDVVGTILGTALLGPDHTAGLSTYVPVSGTYRYTATYQGDRNNLPSTSDLSVVELGDLPPLVLRPFSESMAFWAWVQQYYPQVVSLLAAADPDPNAQVLFAAWGAWLHDAANDFADSQGFWEWVARYHSDVLDVLEQQDKREADHAVFQVWKAWLHENGYS